jgi:hypothetical protein
LVVQVRKEADGAGHRLLVVGGGGGLGDGAAGVGVEVERAVR